MRAVPTVGEGLACGMKKRRRRPGLGIKVCNNGQWKVFGAAHQKGKAHIWRDCRLKRRYCQQITRRSLALCRADNARNYTDFHQLQKGIGRTKPTRGPNDLQMSQIPAFWRCRHHDFRKDMGPRCRRDAGEGFLLQEGILKVCGKRSGDVGKSGPANPTRQIRNARASAVDMRHAGHEYRVEQHRADRCQGKGRGVRETEGVSPGVSSDHRRLNVGFLADQPDRSAVVPKGPNGSVDLANGRRLVKIGAVKQVCAVQYVTAPEVNDSGMFGDRHRPGRCDSLSDRVCKPDAVEGLCIAIKRKRAQAGKKWCRDHKDGAKGAVQTRHHPRARRQRQKHPAMVD